MMRGDLRSRPSEDVAEEVRLLAGQGVQEVVLIAQDSTHYGSDIGGADIAALLRQLAQIDGPRWLRLMYAYPTRVNDRLIEVLAGEPRVCRYVDMPLQHASDRVLAAMKRPGTAQSYLRLIHRLRDACPDITIRTTMILGFPGEAPDDFERLMEFVAEAQFDRLGAFRYSPEPGTPAASYAGAVPPAQVDERYGRLMALQQRISLERNRRWVGRTIPVLVEGRQKGGELICRSERDAPDIDGTVLVGGPAARKALPGEWIQVTVTGAQPYDLVARARSAGRPG
jgi:ribosomal protein S12 methylthiotransferase